MNAKRPSLGQQWRIEVKLKPLVSPLQHYANWEYKPEGRHGVQTRPLGIVKSDRQFFYLYRSETKAVASPRPKADCCFSAPG